jgi:hypothetical protein
VIEEVQALIPDMDSVDEDTIEQILQILRQNKKVEH